MSGPHLFGLDDDAWLLAPSLDKLDYMLKKMQETAMRRVGMALRLQTCTWAAIRCEEQEALESLDHLLCLPEMPRLEPGRCLGSWARRSPPSSERRRLLSTASARCVQCPAILHAKLRLLHASVYPACGHPGRGISAHRSWKVYGYAVAHDMSRVAFVAEVRRGVADVSAVRRSSAGCLRHPCVGRRGGYLMVALGGTRGPALASRAPQTTCARIAVLQRMVLEEYGGASEGQRCSRQDEARAGTQNAWQQTVGRPKRARPRRVERS